MVGVAVERDPISARANRLLDKGDGTESPRRVQPPTLDAPQWVAAAAIIVKAEAVLALRRAPHKPGAGLWETVSGRILPGEDPLAAVAREVAEECGLTVRIAPRPVDAYAASREGAPMVVICYRAEYVRGRVRRSEEHDAHRWLTVEALGALDCPPRLLEAIRRAQRIT